MDKSLSTMNPEVAKEWHPTKNGSLMPSDVTYKTPRKVWWLCLLGHEWETQVRVRTERMSGCRVCSNKLTLKGFNDLATTHPELAKEWHPKLNARTACEVTSGTPKKYWWIGTCGHEWESPVRNRVNLGAGCLVCSSQKVLKGFNDLETLHPEVAQELHPTLNNKTASAITAGSGKKYWWQCSSVKEHIWFSTVSGRTGKRKRGCPSCNNGGFNPNRESILYFIGNPKLKCYKIGISHPNSKRMEDWNKTGWTLIHEVSHASGHDIVNLETLMLRWIRKELKLPVALKMWETGSYGGFSETFSMDVKEFEVIEKIDSTWESILFTSPETYAS